jgi:hypothetical protein
MVGGLNGWMVGWLDGWMAGMNLKCLLSNFKEKTKNKKQEIINKQTH